MLKGWKNITKKLIAMLLSLACILSTASPAFAEEAFYWDGASESETEETEYETELAESIIDDLTLTSEDDVVVQEEAPDEEAVLHKEDAASNQEVQPAEDNDNEAVYTEDAESQEEIYTVPADIVIKEKDSDKDGFLKVNVKAQAGSSDTEFRIYFWQYDGTLPQEAEEWETYFTDPCEGIVIEGMDEFLEMDLPIISADGEEGCTTASLVYETEDDSIESVCLVFSLSADINMDTDFYVSMKDDAYVMAEACYMDNDDTVTADYLPLYFACDEKAEEETFDVDEFYEDDEFLFESEMEEYDPEFDDDFDDEFELETEPVTEEETEAEIQTLAASDTAFAVYSATDNSLTFYAGSSVPSAGSTYNGKTVTNVYTGFETETWSGATNALWYSIITSITKVVIDNSFKNVQPVSLAYWFNGMTNATFEGLENIDTSKVTTLYYTFRNCSSLANVDGLSGWNTSNVTTLSNTFCSCRSLSNVDGLSGWDTSQVISLSNTFYNCSSLSNVDGLSGWDTSNVTSLFYTFYKCSSLSSIDISGWDTSKVADMGYMFYSCSSLETIYSDDNNFVTTAVISGDNMFYNCSKLVGGNGTEYSSRKITYTMAHVDTTSNPGYFTYTEKEAFAVFSGDDNSLTFYYGIVPEEGGSYKGKTVTNVYTGFDTSIYSSASNIPWYSIRTSVKSVRFDESFADVKPKATAWWFYGMTGCTSIDTANLDTSEVTTMEEMFWNCTSLSELDVSDWDVGNVTNMHDTFSGMEKIEYLDVSKWDVRNVETMYGMFYNCQLLEYIPVENWKTDSLTDMHGVFDSCSGLVSVDLSRWDTSKVTDMSQLFIRCTSLASIDISGFDTVNVTTMRSMFAYCSSITEFDVSGLNTENVTDMYDMFAYCSSLTRLDVSGFNTKNVTTMQGVFYDCPSLETIYSDDNNFVTSAVTSGSVMFTNCSKLVGGNGTEYSSSKTSYTMAHVDTASNPGYFTYAEKEAFAVYSEDDNSLTFYYGMVPEEGTSYRGKTVTNVYTGFEDTPYSDGLSIQWHSIAENVLSVSFDATFASVKPTYTEAWFWDFTNCTEINLENLDTSDVKRMRFMFQDCNSLTELDVSGFDTTNVTNMYQMFYGCSSLTELDVSGFDTGNVTTMYRMFRDCSSLTELDVSRFDTGNVTTMYQMFYNCSSLKELDVSGFDTENVTNMQYMFDGCHSLQYFDFSGWDTQKVTSSIGFMTGCSSLEYVTIGVDFTLFSGSGAIVSQKYWYSDPEHTILASDNYMRSFTGGAGTYYPHDQDPEDITKHTAIYSADDNSLTFYYCQNVPDIGDTYNGKKVTGVWTEFTMTTFSADADQPWAEYRSQIKSVYVDESFSSVSPASTAYWFDNFENCTEMDLKYLDTSEVLSMMRMFGYCSSLEYLDVSTWETDNLNSIAQCMRDCTSLKTIDLSNFDVSNVTAMANIFNGCSSLETVILCGWDTSSATGMASMFNACSSLKTIYTDRDFVLDNVTNINNMFLGCTSLVGGNGTKYDSSKVTGAMAHIDTASNPGYFTYAEREAFAVYSADDNSLTFYYGMVPEEGDSYRGKTVTNVYTGFETETWSGTSSIPWYSLRTSIKTVVIDSTFKNVQPVSLAYWFYEMKNATFEGLGNIDTSQVTTLYYTFDNCSSLTNVDGLSEWDTSKVTTLQYTFRGCSSLANVDGLSGWNTSKVTTLYNTFYNCSSLANVDGLSGWGTSKVTTLYNTFYNCSSLANVDGLSGWDTSKVTTLYQTFYNCNSLTNVDGLSGWDTSNVTTLYQTFYNCSSLTNVDGLSGWDTSNVTTLERTFYNCSSLANVDGLSGWNTSNVTTLRYTFYNCSSLANVDGLSGWNTSKVTTLYQTFYKCSSLANVDGLSGLDTPNVTTLYGTFDNCSSLANVDGLSGWNTSNVTTLRSTFYKCSSLANVDALSGWDTSKVTTLEYTFYDCSKLTNIDISNWNTSKVTNMQYMFYGCSSLETIYSDDSNFVTTAVTSGSSMFTNCLKLVGGNGTKYSSSNMTYEMAHVDTEDDPGYFTDANDNVKVLFEWNDDYSSCNAAIIYSDGSIETVSCAISALESVAPTCTASGEITYTANATNPRTGTVYTDTKTAETSELGHDYNDVYFHWGEWSDDYTNDYTTCTAYLTCTRCEDVQTVECTVTSVTEEASCTEPGNIVYTATCTFEGNDYTNSRDIVINPYGHDFGDPEFVWSHNHTECTAIFPCKRCNGTEEVHCAITSTTVEPTCTTDGSTTYTAECTFEDETYSDTQVVELPATGHSYREPSFSWSDDYSECTAVFICSACNDEQTVSCEISTAVVDPECTVDGSTIYTATVTVPEGTIVYTDVKETPIPAAGHDWVETDEVQNGSSIDVYFECTNCGAEKHESVMAEIVSESGMSGSIDIAEIPWHELIGDDELASFDDDTVIDIVLVMEDINETVPEEDASLVEDLLAGEQASVFYIEIDLSMKVSTADGESTEYDLHEVPEPVTVTVAIPESMQTDKDGEYAVIRVHEGEAEVLDTTDNGDWTLTFTTDKFSTYAIAFLEESMQMVLNLGNGNGTRNFGDYSGTDTAGTLMRYTIPSEGTLISYEDEDRNVEIRLPSDSDLGNEFTVIDAVGDEDDDDYLPDVTVELEKEAGYDYRLIGWVNIATGEYYDVSNGPVTAKIDLTDDNVFYADWISASHDYGSSSDANLRTDTVSTSNFMAIHMYDYSDLFNMYSASLEQNGIESETWTDSGSMYSALNGEGDILGNSFLFVNDGTGNSSGKGLLQVALNRTLGNTWTGEGKMPRNAEECWGITSTDSTLLSLLFDQSSTMHGVEYVGEGDYLFWIDENGYYTYNSKQSAAAYSQTDQRFYLYNGTQSVSNTSFPCFLPFNKYGSTLSAVDGTVNYWFGMDMAVDFYLPASTESGGNKINDQDMVFNFSGDDDILVFIDGNLILDMSGIHDESFGSIDFTNGTVTIGMSSDSSWNITDGTTSSFSLAAGNHKLQVYYLERGGYASNLAVQFNISPLWEYKTGDVQTVTAEKVWQDGQGNAVDADTLENKYGITGVDVGLFDVIGENTEDIFGYTLNGSVYTVQYTDDHGIMHSYEYDASVPSLTFSEGGAEPVIYSNIDENGRVVDNNGYVISWLENDLLHIRIDMQTLNEGNGWTYAWELLDPDGQYEALELSTSSLYTTETFSDELNTYYYWSVIGEKEVEESLNTEGFSIILTDAADQATETLGDTKDAEGWVIVADSSGVTTQKAEFSQIATLETAEINGQTTFVGTYGVTSMSAVDALGSGAVWYTIDSGHQEESAGAVAAEGFYLYCMIDGNMYYLTAGSDETALTVTEDYDAKSEFFYDALGEFRVVRENSNLPDRVVISADGEISMDHAELVAATNDIRIFTLKETETGGFAFTAVNTVLPDIAIRKTDDNGTAISSAVFHILNEDGNMLKFKAYESDEYDMVYKPDDDGIYDITAGYICIEGLPVGTYFLEEVQAPEGYYGTEGRIELTILPDGTVSSDQAVFTGNEYTFSVVNRELRDLSVEKLWDDNDNQDGIRPYNITLQLYADGEPCGTSVTLHGTGNEWSHTWTDLFKYNEDGSEIVYTVEEDRVDGYETVIDGMSITNIHVPETVSIEGIKIWDDSNDQDGVRPDYIIIELIADGEVIDSIEVTEDDDWSWNFEDLPKYRDGGIEIQYAVMEYVNEDYSTSYGENGEIINHYEPSLTSVSVTKYWDDNNNQDGLRAGSVTVELLADGEETGMTLTLDESNNWISSFEDLDEYHAGTQIEYTYTIREYQIDGYDIADITGDMNEGYIITNHHEPETASVSGTKMWNDDNNRDGIRPESIVVHLFADEEEIDSMTVTEADEWSWTFDNLPKYRDEGAEIVYTIDEDPATGYETVIEGYDITNTHTIETVEIEGTKTWDDDDDRDGLRPEEITVRLFADEEETDSRVVSETDNWSWSFGSLPKYRDGGIEIVYTVSEDAVEGYEASIEGYDITNTHVPETIDITGFKTWDDADDQDGKRPDDITIELIADGEFVQEIVVTAEDGWSWSFNGLPKYRDGGIEIQYSVMEHVSEDYSTSYGENGEIINSYEPSKTSISVTKYWDDNNNQDGLRAGSVTVELLADGEETGMTLVLDESNNWTSSFEDLDEYHAGTKIEYSYTIKEYQAEGYEISDIQGNMEDGYIITNFHEPETVSVSGTKIWDDDNNRDGIRPEGITVRLIADEKETDSQYVTEADGWSYTFDNLPKYRDEGIEIIYSVVEDVVEGYAASIDGYDISNTHVTETVNIEGVKIWEDDNDRDGIRPEEITIRLFADEEEIDNITVSEEDEWSWSFTELPKYRDGGIEINYSVSEDPVAGYETETEGYDITNIHTPETVSIEGSKTWDDDNNRDGLRPEEITVRLYADDEEVAHMTTSEADEWKWSFEDLPKYRDGGIEIVYTVSEDTVEGYDAVIEGYDITNTHKPETVDVDGFKTWDDADNQDGVRPEHITIELIADGEIIKSIEVAENDGWSWSFDNLPKYRDGGIEIQYAVMEYVNEDYSTSYGENGEIINHYEPSLTSVSVTKYWDDNNNQDGLRTGSVTVELLTDGEETGMTLTLDESNNWTASFEDLDEYHAGTQIEYTYTIREYQINGYDVADITGDMEQGYIITNHHEPETISLSGTKTWNDDNDRDGIRPDSITVHLFADEKEIDSMTVTEADEWSWTFDNLPKYRDEGAEIVYTIAEDPVADYETAVEGYDITNTHVPETVDIEGSKTWDDNDDLNGLRPEEITIRLFADEEENDSITVNAEDGWSWKFTDLLKYRDEGTEIIYTIEEDAVDQYETVYDGYDITNRLKTYGFNLQKTDDAGDEINGAAFTLSDKDEAVISFAAEENVYTKCADDDENATTELPAGSIRIEGLPEGTYILKEVKAPDGYIALKDEIILTIGEGGVSVDNENDQVSVEGYTVIVENVKASALLSTGGFGTRWMLLLAIAMIAASTALLVFCSRKHSYN